MPGHIVVQELIPASDKYPRSLQIGAIWLGLILVIKTFITPGGQRLIVFVLINMRVIEVGEKSVERHGRIDYRLDIPKPTY